MRVDRMRALSAISVRAARVAFGTLFPSLHWGVSSAGERLLDTQEVTGSIPVRPTSQSSW